MLSTRFLLMLLIGVSTFVGCNQPIYEEQFDFNENGWANSDPISFEFEIDDISVEYDIVMDILHKSDYPYENFYVKIESYAPEGLAQNQIQTINLSSGKGNWLGDCNDDSCLLSMAFITRSKFNTAGKYKITLTQYSRIDPLHKLESIRLHMYQSKTQKNQI